MNGGNGMNLVGTENLIGRYVAEPQKADLACNHGLGHGPHGVFDGCGRIGVVGVPKVYMLHAQTIKAVFQSPLNVVRFAIDVERESPSGRHLRAGLVRLEHNAELGGNTGLIAPVAHGPADQLFIVTIAIGIGCVNQRAAFVQGVPDDVNGIGFIGSTIIPLEAHGAVSDSTDRGPPTAKISS